MGYRYILELSLRRIKFNMERSHIMKSKKILGLLLAAVMVAPTLPLRSALPIGQSIVYAAEEAPVIVESSGWHESAYIKWQAVPGAESYNVYVAPVGGSYTLVDKELIREYANYIRADVPGLTPGNYRLKVVPVVDGRESTEEISDVLTVDSFVREGFAFSKNSPYGNTTGGYNADGSVNSGADIVYVTNENKDSVTINGDSTKGVGFNGIMAYRQSNKITTPLIVRIIGKVEMPGGVENYMLRLQDTSNITIEGIGDDATVHGWGFTMKRACNIEVRNIGIMWYGGVGGDGDSLSLDTENKNIWIHNIDFFYGAPGKDSDQAKGDGSIDLKARTDYVTVSYCHFWDSGKSCVAGGVWEAKNPDDPEAKIFVTYHHNWFDHSDSRHPRCVAGSVHVYNNYYDGNSVYGVGAAVQSSLFVESNYFRNCDRPMIIASQGSDVYDSATGTYKTEGTLSGQTGGMIKEYGNVIEGAKRFYTQLTTPDEGQIDAYSVLSPDEQVPSTVTALSGGSVYNNFDTNPDIMYSYNPDTAEEAKLEVMAEAGRLNGGDFKWTFSAEDDDLKDIDPELQSAIINYTSPVVKTNVDSVEQPTETTTTGITEGTTTVEEQTTESTTVVPVATDMWTADMAIPSWLTLNGYTQGSNSSSHIVFQNTDSDVADLSKRYSGTAGSEISISLSSDSIVSIYIATDDNSPKGSASVSFDGTSLGSYTMPGRKDADATPIVVTTEKGGTLKIVSSSKSLLYKIAILSTDDGGEEPEKEYSVTLNIKNNTDTEANLTVGDNSITVGANSAVSKVLTLVKGTYSISVSDKSLTPDPAVFTVDGDITVNSVISRAAQNVLVYNGDGSFTAGYSTITDAINADTTVDGSVIYIKPGYYNESFEVNKSVSLQKAENSEDEVVIYSSDGTYGGSMKGAVRVSAANVTIKGITFLNNINASYGDIDAVSSNGTTGAAIIADGDNSVYENCKFISVQDTVNIYHYSSGNPLLKQTFNNCIFYGATDFICGSSIVDFNNCEFRIFTGVLTSKDDCYVFAPSQMAQWTVNGGKLLFDDTCVVKNFYYGRPWEDRSDNSQTLNIYGMDHDVTLGTKGLMGFGGSTGGGRSHSINDFSFNVYAGSDSSSELIATSNVTALDLFEMNGTTPVIEFENRNSVLLVGDFGRGMDSRFIQNILPDIIEVGFVSEANASADKITDTNTIKTTTLYESIATEKGQEYSLKSVPAGETGVYFGTGIIDDIAKSGEIRVVPYIKYDARHNSDTIDVDPIYKFGTPISITVTAREGL